MHGGDSKKLQDRLRSERALKRARQRAQRAQNPAQPSPCMSLINDLQRCPLNKPPVFYDERKTQEPGNDDPKIANNGIEYDYSKLSIRELFDDYGTAARKESIYGKQKTRQSYIYIISKVIDGRTFFKIGYSDIASKAVVGVRLESHKTTLIPGLKNIGFKLHYLFFYDRLVLGSDSTSYAHLIEQELHKYLRNHKEYSTYIIHYPSSRPSEWYLPSAGKFQEFMKYVLYFISVQIPKPKHAYHFSRQNNKDKRIYMDKFFPKTTPANIREFRHDFSEQMAQIKVTQKEEKSQIQLKKGSLQYFRDALLTIKEEGPPLGDDVEIKKVIFYNKATTSLLKSREYYVLLSSMGYNYKTLNAFIPLLGKASLINEGGDDDDDDLYVAHIGKVLQKMDQLDTIDNYGLRSNLNHYNNEGIQRAKVSYMSTFSDRVAIPINELSWLIGRYLKDTSGKTYTVTELHSPAKQADQVDEASCVEVDAKTLKKKKANAKKANIFTVIHLVVDYHDSKPPSLKLNADYGKEMKHMNPNNAKFSLHDFITIKKGFYEDPDTKEPINVAYDGIITAIEHKLWAPNKPPELCYDILFADGSEWFHTTASIDKNASLKSPNYEQQQERFLSKIKGSQQVRAKYIMEKLGFRGAMNDNDDDLLNNLSPVVTTRKRTRKKSPTKAKKVAPKTNKKKKTASPKKKTSTQKKRPKRNQKPKSQKK